MWLQKVQTALPRAGIYFVHSWLLYKHGRSTRWTHGICGYNMFIIIYKNRTILISKLLYTNEILLIILNYYY